MAVAAGVDAEAGGAWLRAASLREIQARGVVVFTGGDRPIALFWDGGAVHALDNRCPHMGFPLSRGTVADGIVTCHWHHARFDLRSGCTFDLFSDDAPAYDARIEEDAVYVRPRAGADPRAAALRRLREGMELNVDLVMVKSVLALLQLGVSPARIVAEAGLFGAENRESFGPGLVILTAMANVAPLLPREQAALALCQGVTRAAADAAGRSPHRLRPPLQRADIDPDTATRWLRRWTAARHADGAERTLQTLLASGAGPAAASAAVFGAVTDRIYADAGHALDFANKAFELAELVGWGAAARILGAAVPTFVPSRGAEESSSWRSPVDLAALVGAACAEIPAACRAQGGARWAGTPEGLANEVLGDDPARILAALLEALRGGARAADIALAVAQAAALRIARFGSSNEFSDWDTALHTFTYSQAVHHAVVRASEPDVLRGAFHGALSVYQDRFLNVPPARLPGPADVADLPADGAALCAALLQAADTQGGSETAARLTSRYLDLDLPPEPLLGTLAEMVLREDAAFHTLQCLEASIRLFRQWDGAPPGRIALIALARYGAAHAPTQRAFLQTVTLARRLQRGEALHEEVAG
jgi:nitrite reductase/ring-hydroxylating ferredoxin subunit